ncbi:MAG: Gfo/Idh/MocA family oxidoreductase [Bryobacteraceae bacterium]
MNRRHFLAGAAATPMFAQSPNGAVGVGMVGVGNRGGYVMKSVLANPSAKVTAICDTKPDRLDKAASEAAAHSPKTYRDYRDLIADKNVDAVHISTPCDLHVEMALAALAAGKHVYCEKPVGITPESIGRLVRAARASKKVFQVGQQLRSSRRIQKTVARIHDGIVGKVVMIKAQRHASDDLPHDASSAEWFFDAKRSGDVIVEMAVHNLDICNWVAQSRPAMASGYGGALIWPNDPPGRTNMDGYTLSYDYTNGVKLSFTQVFFHPRGMPGNGQFFYVYGTEGAVDVMDSKFYPRKKGEQPREIEPPSEEKLDAQHVAAFVDAITKGTPVAASIEVGAVGALTAILGREAIYRKKTMSWVDLGVDL